mgnify:CR=1 FL=1
MSNKVKTSRDQKTVLQKSTKEKIENLHFSIPSDTEQKDLIKTFKLTSSQVHNLNILLRQIIADLEHFQAIRSSLPPRTQLVTRLKRLEKLFGLVIREIDKGKDDLAHLLPHDLGSFLGLSMSISAIGKATNQILMPVHVDLAISNAVANGHVINQNQIEMLQAQKREALGLQHSEKLFSYITRGIYEHLRLWVELDRQNKGGRAPKLLRRYIASWLIYEAEETCGIKPTVAQTGKFVKFVEALFRACGLPDEGVDKIMPDLVKRVRDDKKKHVKDLADPNSKLRILVGKPQ